MIEDDIEEEQELFGELLESLKINNQVLFLVMAKKVMASLITIRLTDQRLRDR